MGSPFIEVRGLSKSFRGQQVLRDIGFTVEDGQIVGLLGPNGAGKTTIIRLLNGVIEPDGGTMTVGGLDPVRSGDDIRQMSGIVTEGAGLYHEMSGYENLKFFSNIYGVTNRTRIDDLLDQFDLTEHRDKPAGTYSTGMKKRLALAKALLHRPKLLFLDEPTNGLDPEGIRTVLSYLKKLNEREGTTIFLCSHVLHQIESVCGRYIFMEKGAVIDQGTQAEIEAKYMRHVELEVETGLELRGGDFGGFPAERVHEQTIRFRLPSKDAIPDLLRKLLEQTWVHSARICNRDLESLYFQVRGQRQP